MWRTEEPSSLETSTGPRQSNMHGRQVAGSISTPVHPRSHRIDRTPWARCIDTEALKRTVPTRGYLNVHQRFDRWARRDVYVATLTLGDFPSTEQLLPTLDQVRIG